MGRVAHEWFFIRFLAADEALAEPMVVPIRPESWPDLGDNDADLAPVHSRILSFRNRGLIDRAVVAHFLSHAIAPCSCAPIACGNTRAPTIRLAVQVEHYQKSVHPGRFNNVAIGLQNVELCHPRHFPRRDVKVRDRVSQTILRRFGVTRNVERLPLRFFVCHE